MAKKLLARKCDSVAECRDALVILLACQPFPLIRVTERLRPDCFDLAFVTEVRVGGVKTPTVSLLIGVATDQGVLTRQFDWQESKVQARTVEALLAETGLAVWWSTKEAWTAWALWLSFMCGQRDQLTLGRSVWLTGLAFGQLDDQFFDQRVGNIDLLGALSAGGGAVAYEHELGVVDVDNEYPVGTVTCSVGEAVAFWADRWCVAERKFADLSEDSQASRSLQQAVRLGIPVAGYVTVLLFKPHRRVLVRCTDLKIRPFGRREAAFDCLALSSELLDLIRGLSIPVSPAFVDVVDSKSTGQNILLQGPPGVGKTLICERMAEHVRRPLYIVQAAQLGLSVTELSTRLQVVARRAKRWNAAVLIDDADVFVAPRDRGLEQNAIVGEIQRFLERDGLQVFLTTNCEVDPAVLSRCFAVLRIPPPTLRERISIWNSLADRNGMKFAPALVTAICRDNAGMTGRSILQLLKLIHQVGLRQPYRVADVEALLKYVLVK